MKAKAKLLTDGNAKGHINVTGTAAFSPVSSRVPSPTPSSTSASSEVEPDGGTVGRETRRRLVEWWGREYCASRMNVCVIGRGALNPLRSLSFRVDLNQQNHSTNCLIWFLGTFPLYPSIVKTHSRSLATIRLGPMRWV